MIYFRIRQYFRSKIIKTRKIDNGRRNYFRRNVNKISINFINNLYIGVNEASNPLSHHKLSTTSSPIDFLVTYRLLLDASITHSNKTFDKALIYRGNLSDINIYI